MVHPDVAARYEPLYRETRVCRGIVGLFAVGNPTGVVINLHVAKHTGVDKL